MNIGFIGAGNMTLAIIKGICNKKVVPVKDMLISNRSLGKLINIKKEYGIKGTTDNKTVAKKVDILFLCVKPQVLDTVIPEISKYVKEDATIVSIAAGKTIKYLEETFNRELEIIRVMPNTPALIGEGISAVCLNDKAKKNKERLNSVFEILNCLGESEIVDESMIDIVGQIAGASPAWISMIIEGMADGAVYEGMSREMAYRFAAAGVAGAGKLALSIGGNPAVIKDMCSSPKDTTIEGIKVLEEGGIRGKFMDAVIAASEKSKRM